MSNILYCNDNNDNYSIELHDFFNLTFYKDDNISLEEFKDLKEFPGKYL
jgi:hypothetical protein